MKYECLMVSWNLRYSLRGLKPRRVIPKREAANGQKGATRDAYRKFVPGARPSDCTQVQHTNQRKQEGECTLIFRISLSSKKILVDSTPAATSDLPTW